MVRSGADYLRRAVRQPGYERDDLLLVAKSVADAPSPFKVGDRVFHQKFGNGNVAAIEGNKLTIDFDRAGQKKVLDGFVTGV